MAKEDYYGLLGVGRQASQDDIRKAYRRLAMKYHPDRNKGDKQSEQKFKEIKEAYDALSDEQKRAAYDRFGHAGVSGMGGGAGAGHYQDIFGDIFENFFGGGSPFEQRRSTAVYRGSDIEYTLPLSLEEAAFGTEKKVPIARMETCARCDGKGAEPGSKLKDCSTCGGSGRVGLQQGIISFQQTCPACQGRGQVVETPCRECLGRARVEVKKTLSVKVPAGVDEGDNIRLAGEGESGIGGGPAGDLYIQIRLRPHKMFTRHGKDLLIEVPIPFTLASLGGEIEVPSLAGRLKLKIPQGTQSGKKFRMRGKGIRPLRSGVSGDLICQANVETPVNLTAHQKELLKELDASLSARKHSPRTENWVDNIKQFFNKFDLNL